MTAILMGLGGAALLGANVVIWTWAGGIVCELVREWRAPHLVAENERLRREAKLKDEVIATCNRELDSLHQEAARLKAHMEKCGVRGTGLGLVRM